MLSWLLKIFLLFEFFLGGNLLVLAQGLSDEEVLKKYNLEMLDAAATFLRTQVDQGLIPENQRSKVIASVKECQMSSEDANLYLLALQPIFDEQLKITGQRLEAQIKSKPKKTTQYRVFQGGKWNRCKEDCRCGMLVSLMEQLTSDQLSAKDEKKKIEMQNIASKQSAKDSLKCGESRTWVCKSDLLKFLKIKALKLKLESNL